MIITPLVIAACLSLETNLLVQLVGAPSCFGLRFPVFSGAAEPENWKQVRCLSKGGNKGRDLNPLWTRGEVSRGVLRRLLSGHERGSGLLRQTESSLRSHPSVKLLFFGPYWGTRAAVGGSSPPYLNWSSMALTGTGTSVNRHHSKGIKEALHWFVLEAVLLICLPTNECLGPVFPACVDKGTPSLY